MALGGAAHHADRARHQSIFIELSHKETHLKHKLLLVLVGAFVVGIVGCSEDINKNVPKSLPPGVKAFQSGDKEGGSKELPAQSRPK